MKKLVFVVPIVVLVAVWVFWGRFAVEGGKAEWAMINNRVDVLKEALASGTSQEERQNAFSRAASRDNLEGMKLLLAAGVNPNQSPRRDTCYLAYASIAAAELLLESGADPKLCRPTRWDTLVSSVLDHNRHSASEAALVALLKKLRARGAVFAATDEAKAKGFGLPAVAAYLHAPDQAGGDEPIQKLALRGTEPELDAAELAKVCEGKGIEKLPSYDKPANHEVAPVYVVETLFDKPRDGGQNVPGWWQSRRALGHTQVVACARVIDKKVSGECKYEGGVTVSYYNATFDLLVLEAKTGRQLARESVSLSRPPEKCGSFVVGNTSTGHFPDYSKELTGLLAPILGAS